MAITDLQVLPELQVTAKKSEVVKTSSGRISDFADKNKFFTYVLIIVGVFVLYKVLMK